MLHSCGVRKLGLYFSGQGWAVNLKARLTVILSKIKIFEFLPSAAPEFERNTWKCSPPFTIHPMANSDAKKQGATHIFLMLLKFNWPNSDGIIPGTIFF